MDSEYDYPPEVHQRNDGRANQYQYVVNEYGRKLSIISLCVAVAALSIAFSCALFLLEKSISAQNELGHEKAQAVRELATEKRLNTEAIDELRLETRQALKNAGVSAPDTHEH